MSPSNRRPHYRDRELAKRLLGGDERSYRELFDHQVPRLYRIALSRLGHDADAAEEAIQRTLVLAMRKLHTYRGEASLLTWLATLCRHEIGELVRRGLAQQERSLSDAAPEIETALELLECRDLSPEQNALRSEIQGLVRSTLDRLPERYAVALEWKYLEGLSVREIAERWESGTVAVQSVLARAREAFRDGFGEVAAAAGLQHLADRLTAGAGGA